MFTIHFSQATSLTPAEARNNEARGDDPVG